jgi:exosome complex RNA-binding protein Rrp42 (RNase PH superfamily)
MFKLKHNAKRKRPKNDLQNTTQNTKDRTTRNESLNSDSRPHTITKMNDNWNMDSTIAESSHLQEKTTIRFREIKI